MELTEERIKFTDWLDTLNASDKIFMRFPHHLFMFYKGGFGTLAEITLDVETIREGMTNPSDPDYEIYDWLRKKALVDEYIVSDNGRKAKVRYELWWEGEPCEDMM